MEIDESVTAGERWRLPKTIPVARLELVKLVGDFELMLSNKRDPEIGIAYEEPI